jgi:hypothetical protein
MQSRLAGVMLALGALVVAALAGSGGATGVKPKADTAWTQGFKPAFTWSWRESQGRYRYLTKLGVGKFTHLSAAPVLIGFTTTGQVAASCSGFDAGADGVAPAALQVTNETKGASAKLGTQVFALDATGFYASTKARPTKLRVAAGYSSGVQCYDISDPVSALSQLGQGWRVTWSKPTRPGKSPGVSYGYLIIHDYYRPGHPAGDPVMLRNALLQVASGSTYSPPRKLKSLQGPGVFRSPSGALVGIIPLGGKRSCHYRRTSLNPELRCG